MEQRQKCDAFKVVYKCPECKIGEMMCLENENRVIYTFGPAMRAKKQLAHRCSNCGYVLGLYITYPYLQMEVVLDEKRKPVKDFKTKGSA